MAQLTSDVENYYIAERAFFENISVEFTNLSRHLSLYRSAVTQTSFNFLAHRVPYPSPLELFKVTDQYFKTHRIGWIWVARQECVTEALHEQLKTVGFVELEQTCDMILKDFDFTSEPPLPDLTFKASKTSLADWSIPQAKAFKMTSLASSQYQKAHRNNLNNHRGIHHLVGYLEKQPVCSLSLTIRGNLARIDDLGTLPEHHGKGYGSGLVKFALNLAHQRGVNTCFLECAIRALPFYHRFGFQLLFKNTVFGEKN